MSIARHTAYNLLGTALPIVLALVTVPEYLKLVGAERYGVLSLAWIMLGYFGVFDLGLGRAVMQRIAASRAETNDTRARVFGTALAANSLVGLAGALLLVPAAYFAFRSGFGMSAALRDEAMASVPILALALPVSTLFGLLNGALIGREQFRSVNSITVISALLFQLLPLATAFFLTNDLSALLGASVFARGAGAALLAWKCGQEFGRAAFSKFDRQYLSQLLQYGSWVTVSGLISPLLVVGDRFFIGRALGAVAVAIYTLPYQITSRLSPLAGALGNALFPKLAANELDEADRLTDLGFRTLFACLTAPVAFGIAVMAPVMEFWIGRELGGPAGPIGRVMLVAAWLNVFGQIPFWRLQARGMPRMIALAHLGEAIVYFPILVVLIAHFGLIGAAFASMLRMAFDAAILWKLANCRMVATTEVLLALVIFACEELAIRLGNPGIYGTLAIATVTTGLAVTSSWFILPIKTRHSAIRSISEQFNKIIRQ